MGRLQSPQSFTDKISMNHIPPTEICDPKLEYLVPEDPMKEKLMIEHNIKSEQRILINLNAFIDVIEMEKDKNARVKLRAMID